MKAAFKALTVVVFCVFLAGCGKAGEHEDSGVLHTADASQSGFTAASGEGGETQEDVSGGDVSENGTANITESEDGQVSEEAQCLDNCDDGLFCNGQEVCVSGVCVRGNAPDCSMSNACLKGFCNEDAKACDSAQDLNVADKDRDTHLSLTCGGGDCDDLHDDIHPEADEKCDTIDNNCDGSIDENCECAEGVTQLCGRDEGACESGTQTCVVGNDGRTFWAPCTGKAPSAEMCDFIDNDCDSVTDNEVKNDCGECGATPFDGPPLACDWLDNNCDGTTDEGCECRNTEWQPCGVGLGECATAGFQFCTNGFWDNICASAVVPQVEICDGRDNDCDGETDEDFDLASDFYNCGVCRAECWPGEICEKGRCLAENGELPDAGIVDAGMEEDGGVDAGQVCVSSSEVCDAKDNDCDGHADNGLIRACSTTCESGTEICERGQWTNCTAKQPISCLVYSTCKNAAGCEISCPSAPDELCDAKDNDCDGTADEGVKNTYYRDADGDGYGANSQTTTACSAPTGYVAQGGDCNDNDVSMAPNKPELCDAKDNDCDGQADEDFPYKGQSCSAGIGECIRAGTFVCKTDKTGTECSATPGGPTDELCDSKDNDCDGQTDSADADLVLTNCEKQNGVCNGKKHSASQCVSGQWQTCTATEYGSDYESSETRCDNLNNDCDGVVDESLSQACSTACGSGTETCQSGQWKNCTAQQPQTEVCDNRDNNCDGAVDEGIVDCYPVMCAAKTQGGPCYAGKCIYQSSSGPLTVAGRDVLDCGKISLVVPSTMTISFDYKASAGSCWQVPYFTVRVNGNTASFTFPNCTSGGSASLSISVPSGTTIDGISFTLSSGDWGAGVKIKAITFN